MSIGRQRKRKPTAGRQAEIVDAAREIIARQGARIGFTAGAGLLLVFVVRAPWLTGKRKD